MQLSLLLFAGYLAIGLGETDFDGVVRAVGDGRFEAYMIPPEASNHASFLEQLPSGELLMAWFSGTAEGANKCSIWLARLEPNSTQWSKVELVSQRDGYSNQNPVLFFDDDTKVLHLFHSQQPASNLAGVTLTSEVHAHIWALESGDGRGLNWTVPKLLFGKDGSFDRNRIIISLDNDWIYPIYYSVSGDDNQYSAMEISANHTSWKEYAVKDSNYLVQPSVVRTEPGVKNLQAFFRDRRAGHVYHSVSTDEGHTWSTPEKTMLPNNNAAIQATVLTNKHMAIVFNPTNKARYPLRIAISEDSGQTWLHFKDVETRPAALMDPEASTEYSYPTLLQSGDGYIHVSYTYNRQTIKYVKFKEEWIYS